LIEVVFRTDASVKIGSGHVMRCLTLAEALMKNGVSVTFISRNQTGNLNWLISKKGFKIVELHQPESDKTDKCKNREKGDVYMEWLGVSETADAKDTIHALKNDNLDWLIVDHYSLSEKWENKLRPYVKNIMVIDDLANRRHDCDMLLDQNLFEDMETRYDDIIKVGCTKLLGPEYALLRPGFAEARKSLKPHRGSVERVFVFFGGSDPFNFTVKTLTALSNPKYEKLHIDVVITESNVFKEEISLLVEIRKNTNLYENIDNIYSIMIMADLAFGAGGMNTWERLCLRLPTLAISFSENQKIQLEGIKSEFAVDYFGEVAEIDDQLFEEKIVSFLHKFSRDKNQVDETFALVDGYGFQMVTDWLIGDLSNQRWEVKNATDKDIELYWNWANDEQVRNNALNKEPFTWKTHIEWFRNKLTDHKCSLYLIFIENNPIGQVRFDVEDYFARIDYSIARQFRGRKLGRKVLGLAIEKFEKFNSIKLLGEVLTGNTASAKIFKSLGFSMQKINQGDKVYVKEKRLDQY